MSGEALKARLAGFGVRGSMQADYRLADITWFRVGGPVDLLFQPADEADLALFLKNLPDDVPVMPIGLGSNLLVRDGQMAGVVVRLGMRGFGSVTVEGPGKLRAGCAVPDKALAKVALDEELRLRLLPRQAARSRMNAGANGGGRASGSSRSRGDAVGESHAVKCRDGLCLSSLARRIVHVAPVAPRAEIEAAMQAVQDHRRRRSRSAEAPAVRRSRTRRVFMRSNPRRSRLSISASARA